MRPVFLEGYGKKPLIMYGKKDDVFCLSTKAVEVEEARALDKDRDVAAYELRKVILPIPFRKYALVRKGEYGEVYTFSELRRIPKKQKEGKKIYKIKKLNGLASLCPDTIE